MKKSTMITTVLSLFLLIGTVHQAEAQFGKKAKELLAKKKGKKGKKGKGGNKFASFNDETDEMGMTGQYFSLSDGKGSGLRFVKEADGKVVNELHYYDSSKDSPDAKLTMHENYFRKNQTKLFFYWRSASASSYMELIEVAPGVVAVVGGDRSLNKYDEPIPLDANRKVKDVGAKNKADLDTWDLETAQAKVDMIIGALNSEKMAKTKKKLERFEVYKNYKGKIAFAKGTNYLRNGNPDKPTEKPANFITKRELGETVAYKPYFEQPLQVSHPGAWFNVTYEMAGITTDREALRKASSVYASNIPQMDDDQEYFMWFYPKVTINNSNNVADYAFLDLLRQGQDKFQKGQIYDLKITVWAHKDGENIEAVATGTIPLEYGSNTDKLLFDPIDGWVTKIEDVLDE
ncbi:MAG: hypothetical protein K0U54_10515 [Bacteroidetes bacterium]|nr:hypothetical protein [Bacteroidota bacterium]